MEFMKKFEKELKNYLFWLEEGEISYEFNKERDELSLVAFNTNVPCTLDLHVYNYDANLQGLRHIVIDCGIFREMIEIPTEKILRKIIKVVKSEFKIEEEFRWKDNLCEEGYFYVKSK